MQKKSVREALEELITGQVGRSETSRLKDVYDEIELALQSGVSRQALLDALHADGFTMSLKTFDNALYRIRKIKRSNIIKEQTLAALNIPDPLPTIH